MKKRRRDSMTDKQTVGIMAAILFKTVTKHYYLDDGRTTGNLKIDEGIRKEREETNKRVVDLAEQLFLEASKRPLTSVGDRFSD
jgi:hypothetical protein